MTDKNFLTEAEFATLLKGTSHSRYPKRNYLILLLTQKHGFRASELCTLKLSQIDMDSGRIFCKRLKKSLSTTQPLLPEELRLIRAYLKERDSHCPYLFVSERGTPFTRYGLYYIVTSMAKLAKLPHTHPHMLRHSCGYALANRGIDTRLIQDYLGHRNIQNTVKYTQLASTRFDTVWD